LAIGQDRTFIVQLLLPDILGHFRQFIPENKTYKVSKYVRSAFIKNKKQKEAFDHFRDRRYTSIGRNFSAYEKRAKRRSKRKIFKTSFLCSRFSL